MTGPDGRAVFAFAAPDPDLQATLAKLGVLRMLNVDHIYDTLDEAIAAFRSDQAVPSVTTQKIEELS